MNTNLRHRTVSVIGVSLLLLAGTACSSDSKTDVTNPVTSPSAATTDAPTDAAAAGGTETIDATVATEASATTAAPDSTVAVGVDSVPLPTATDDREAIIEYVGNLAEAAGIVFDEQCVSDLIARLSDADAALVADSARRGGEGDPQLTPEGEAIGDEVENCAVESTTTG